MYIFAKKEKRCYHIKTPTGTVCKMEHGSSLRKLKYESEVAPEGRKLCTMCKNMEQIPKKKRKIVKIKAKKIKNTKNSFYSSFEWKKLRYKVLSKSDGKCCLCGAGKIDGVVLCVDHIKPIRKYPHLSLVENNLQVLCSGCNWGKGSHDETDWRNEDFKINWDKYERY